MRREGYEMCVSRPDVILRKVNGQSCEPFETVWLEIPDECMGAIMQNMAGRKGILANMQKHQHGGISLEFTAPTRGLLGFETDLANMTSGRGVVSHLFKGYFPYCGDFATRPGSTLVSMENGIAKHYALENLQERGRLFIGPGDEVYEGMIVGDNPRPDDILVNPTKAKHLTNMRSQGEGKAVQLEPPIRLNVERALEYIGPDEYVEATPNFIRLRKKILKEIGRRRSVSAKNAAAAAAEAASAAEA
jgi:GTP-binding protein